ncbi:MULTISPECIES: winged helix DNA-binding domain-containing protein [Streptomyces]|uniref:Winged helix DNA-binding domain-containing protein n=2 Tax=Streptomyces harbinensis TaxID=1176198 RepID=A0A1I6VSE6_9ACTN|nr:MULTISPECIES: winged helix DNA-binding domain-containing protein [Streptomyces]QKV71709.1 winged helix DNA-binding domain-containing protein [Streptomyces harbinensis]SFT16589.1 Winged helix DNA-binding domain-containing protein [Streptomyces harbinensis]
MTTVLDTRALNRATLARQLLLERARLPVLDAVAHLGGLQAQEPQEPFTGLWSRLRSFDPGVLSELLVERRVVRTHLMRRTVHLLASDDVLAWRTRHDAMLRQRVLGVYRAELAGVDPVELAAAGRAVLADGEPRSMGELARAVAARWPGPGAAPSARALGEMLVAALIPMAQLPPRGVWRARGGARYLPLSVWLGRAVDPPAPDGDDPVGRALVRRYLAAFGPAATADLRAWSGVAGLPAAVAALREELVVFRDERGRELFDLPGAPRPDPATPAPVRFLPAFDNALLGYQDRGRIVDDAHRGLSVAGARVVLVDGRVAATWTVGEETVRVAPLRRLSADEREEVAREGEALAGFLSEGAFRRVRIGSGTDGDTAR